MRNLNIVLVSTLLVALTVVAKAQTVRAIATAEPVIPLMTAEPLTALVQDDSTSQLSTVTADQTAEQQDELQGPVAPPTQTLRPLSPSEVEGPIQNALDLHKNFSGLLLIGQGDQVLFKAAVGFIPGTGVKYSYDTGFLLASVTKQFTAALILKEVQKGTISLSDPLRKYFPESKISWDAITIKDLLAHTSGMPNEATRYDYIARANLKTRESILKYIEGVRLTPTGDFNYSNCNYFLLGIILEKVTRQNLEVLVKNEITGPLGMTRSKMIPTDAEGFSQLYSPTMDPQAAYPERYFAVGNMVSTVTDLFTWQRALLDDRTVLSSELTTAMVTPQPNTQHPYTPAACDDSEKKLSRVRVGRKTRMVLTCPFAEAKYGYGFRISEFPTEEIVWHTGHLIDHANLVEHYMKNDITVIVLTNKTNYNVFGIANDTVNAVFKLPMIQPPSGRVAGKLMRVRHPQKRKRHLRRSRA